MLNKSSGKEGGKEKNIQVWTTYRNPFPFFVFRSLFPSYSYPVRLSLWNGQVIFLPIYFLFRRIISWALFFLELFFLFPLLDGYDLRASLYRRTRLESIIVFSYLTCLSKMYGFSFLSNQKSIRFNLDRFNQQIYCFFINTFLGYFSTKLENATEFFTCLYDFGTI